ncbi:hypothetical protein IM538_14445 [Cytobacillus suaedae]|nr:hypothetical protein IM538_14445 [Cytobacillus suaedae]
MIKILGGIILDYNKLLAAYRSLWTNRELKALEGDEKEILLEAIERDLKDENAHPRVRKDPHIKFFWAVKRIGQGAISDEEKLQLIDIHIEIVERLDHT